jgi:hypothetical protein
MFKRKINAIFIIFAMLALSSYGVLYPKQALAASLTVMSDTMSRQKASTASSHTIVFRIATAVNSNGNTIVITFPSDFNFTSIVIGEVTMKTDSSTAFANTETLAASPSASAWGAVFSGTQNRVLTLTAPTDGVGAFSLIANSYVQLTYASTHSINASTTGSKSITISTSTGDSGTIAVPIVAGTAADENVVITATVAPSITFTNDDAAIGFGTLSTSAVTYANAGATGSGTDTTAHTMVIVTNATSGYTLTYTGALLTSGANDINAATISSDADGTAGTEQFAISGTLTGTETGAMQSLYDHATPNWKFVAGATTTIASSTAAVTSDSIAMHYLANISGITPAGDYTTTLTYLATANF